MYILVFFFFPCFFNKVTCGDASLVISRCHQGGIFCHVLFLFLFFFGKG
jgi:hypothetical protein